MVAESVIRTDSSTRPLACALLAVLMLLAGLWPLAAKAQGWSAASFERGYVLEGQASAHPSPQRGCDAALIQQLDRQARLQAPPGGWPAPRRRCWSSMCFPAR